MNRHLFLAVFSLLMIGVLGASVYPDSGQYAQVYFGERPFIDIYQMPDDAMEPGHIRIKLSQELSYLPDALVEVDGRIREFGIPELDALCSDYEVTRISRLFGVTGVKT